MKKKKWILVILLIFSVALVGCRRKVTAEEAGILFVNQYIYEDEDKRFIQSFGESKKLKEDLLNSKKDFADGVVDLFSLVGNVVEDEQTKDLLSVWLQRMNTITEYQIKNVVEDKKDKSYLVTYQVSGIDFYQVYKETMDELVAQMLASPKLAQDSLKLSDLTVELLIEAMTHSETIKEPVEVKLSFVKERGKWLLKEKEAEERLNNVLLAFLAGVSDRSEYTEAMTLANQAAMSEAEKAIQEEYEGTADTEKTEAEKKEAEKEEQTKTSLEQEKEAQRKKKEKEQTKTTIETTETYEDIIDNSSKK